MANISRARSRKRAKGEICHLVYPIDSSSSLQPLNLCVRDESLQSLQSYSTIPTNLPPGTNTEEQVPRNPTIRRRKKRSAIFLPPEKLADNDVCICKFKFVAGHTPRLQEKKILSLDSGGNFRFFPELQNQQKQPQQPEKRKQPVVISPLPVIQDQAQSQQLAKPIPDLLPIETVCPTWRSSSNTNNALPVPTSAPSSISINHSAGNRRLSRRQKIEQTFGEKGFLIQTQHVPVSLDNINIVINIILFKYYV